MPVEFEAMTTLESWSVAVRGSMVARVKEGRLAKTGEMEGRILSGTPVLGGLPESGGGFRRRSSSVWEWPKRARRTTSALAARRSLSLLSAKNGAGGVPLLQKPG